MAQNELEANLTCVVIIIGSISALLSAVLTFVALRVRPIYLIRYQHILVAIALTGVVYSICEICAVPYWYVSDGDFVLFAVGPIKTGRFGQNLLLSFAISFMQSLFLIAYSFAFQYAQVCRAEWFRTFPNLVLFSPFLNVLILTNWLIAVVYCFTPTEEKMKKAAKFVWEHMEISINGRAFLGFSLELQKYDPLFYVFILNMLLVFLVFLANIVFCAHRIIVKVSSDLSNRNHYASIYRLLLVQCIAPALFTIFPCSFNMVSGLVGVDLGERVPFVLATLLPMYPAVNTILMIWQVRDYRDYLFCRFCKSKSSISQRGKRKSIVTSM
ncbi:unnamed protein product [Caenorhabditis sp. 36 PRJEB53466]|nr:unnamed protein product [Caenorhabditis sp. 36 PRJEB53466]